MGKVFFAREEGNGDIVKLLLVGDRYFLDGRLLDSAFNGELLLGRRVFSLLENKEAGDN